MGPGNLRQMIIEWYKAHPAFAGSVAWCKRVKSPDPQDGSGKHLYKFCFEYTPNGAPWPQLSCSTSPVLQAGSNISYLQHMHMHM